jgi:hypothetical protein
MIYDVARRHGVPIIAGALESRFCVHHRFLYVL